MMVNKVTVGEGGCGKSQHENGKRGGEQRKRKMGSIRSNEGEGGSGKSQHEERQERWGEEKKKRVSMIQYI